MGLFNLMDVEYSAKFLCFCYENLYLAKSPVKSAMYTKAFVRVISFSGNESLICWSSNRSSRSSIRVEPAHGHGTVTEPSPGAGAQTRESPAARPVLPKRAESTWGRLQRVPVQASVTSLSESKCLGCCPVT